MNMCGLCKKLMPTDEPRYEVMHGSETVKMCVKCTNLTMLRQLEREGRIRKQRGKSG